MNITHSIAVQRSLEKGGSMNRNRRVLREYLGVRRALEPWRLVAALTACVGCLALASIASAGEPLGSRPHATTIPLPQIFTFLFMMLGPFKILGPFVNITRGADTKLTIRIALLATLVSSLALLAAAFLGDQFLEKYGISLPILALAAGIILFLVALQGILNRFSPPDPDANAAAAPPCTWRYRRSPSRRS